MFTRVYPISASGYWLFTGSEPKLEFKLELKLELELCTPHLTGSSPSLSSSLSTDDILHDEGGYHNENPEFFKFIRK